MWQRLLSFLFALSSISAQSFFYSYVDPCEHTVVRSNDTINNEQQEIQVTYYNRTKFFTLEEVLAGQLEKWTQNVFQDFEDLFPCAVNIAEEALASANTINLADELEREDEEDIGASEPSFIGGDIVNTFYDWRSVATFISVYTEENFDLTIQFI